MARIFQQLKSLFQKAPVVSSRQLAKDRLQILIASQRGSSILAGVDMQALQDEVAAVIKVSKLFVIVSFYAFLLASHIYG